jgi:ribose/xylose/arabinose/galactoside ABC-type transport system permease subunit
MTTPTLTYASPGTVGRRVDLRSMLSRIGPFLGLIFVFALFAVLTPRTFLSTGNVQVMLIQTAVVGTAALGMTLIIISGGIDLSVGSTIALVTVAVALLLTRGEALTSRLGATPDGTYLGLTFSQLNGIAALLGGVLTGALCGLLIGLLVTQLRLAPFIVTLGTWGGYRGLAKGLADESMVAAPSTWLNEMLSLTPDKAWMVLPPGVWLMLILAALMAAVLRYTRFGRHVFAIGSNEQTARLCGVRVERTKLLIYVLGATLAGVAGVMQFSYLTVGDPTTASGLELDIIAAVVIGGASLSGGQGTILGTLIGALIMTVVSNGCTKLGLANWVQEIVTAFIIILAVAVDRFRHRRG